ncbi:MAG: exodeoxyribonuclease III [Anaerolineae bacterium]|nr:exodeoxyribonuclease III [Anaerolineae bacterium]
MTNLTLLSWNVNGVRAIHRKGFLTWLKDTAPDILCLQETKASASQLPVALAQPEGYQAHWHSAERKGYSGTALITRQEPLSMQFGLGLEEFDREGRTIIAEYPLFTLINCYFPNGGRDHGRVPFKLAFYDAFLEKCEQLRKRGQPVIFCGDINTAHGWIDLANPKSNQNTTGFLPEERLWLDKVVAAGYVDTFRYFYPETAGQYTWWSMPTRARERNVGWRLDYFFVASEFMEHVVDAFILPEVMGSDHCPVGLQIQV